MSDDFKTLLKKRLAEVREQENDTDIKNDLFKDKELFSGPSQEQSAQSDDTTSDKETKH
jgi:hypothetical protein